MILLSIKNNHKSEILSNEYFSNINEYTLKFPHTMSYGNEFSSSYDKCEERRKPKIKNGGLQWDRHAYPRLVHSSLPPWISMCNTAMRKGLLPIR